MTTLTREIVLKNILIKMIYVMNVKNITRHIVATNVLIAYAVMTNVDGYFHITIRRIMLFVPVVLRKLTKI
jgi:hypothetical protein